MLDGKKASYALLAAANPGMGGVNQRVSMLLPGW